MQFAKLFASTLVSIFILDMIWLGVLAKNVYGQAIGHLLRRAGDELAPNWSAAAVVYVAITIGILCFVLPKANGSYLLAFAWGALFGAVTYGIYDFTNLSMLANWPLKITLVDFVWGMMLCGVSSLIAMCMHHWLTS